MSTKGQVALVSRAANCLLKGRNLWAGWVRFLLVQIEFWEPLRSPFPGPGRKSGAARPAVSQNWGG
jgi:hypothetical protein